MKKKGFDNVASFYDLFAFSFSFGAIYRSRNYFVKSVSYSPTTLILGGGTGDVLFELLKTDKAGKITFVEVSEKMINKAKAKVLRHFPQKASSINFINESYLNSPQEKYDLVVTSFFLDLFDDKEVESIVEIIKVRLKNNGILINTDFYNTGYSYFKSFFFKWLLHILYSFFALTCTLKTDKLPDEERILQENGFNLIQFKSYLFGFIRTEIWKKSTK